MPKHDNDAKPAKHENDANPGDHTPVVDHGVVNVATQDTKSETVTESSEHDIHDLHVKPDPEYELTCNVEIRVKENPKSSDASGGHVEKHVTMSKRRKKEFEGNIVRLNLHDKIFQGMMGLKEFPEPVKPHILVFTSHPLLFNHSTVRTIDVGWDAAHVDENKAHHDLWDALKGSISLSLPSGMILVWVTTESIR